MIINSGNQLLSERVNDVLPFSTIIFYNTPFHHTIITGDVLPILPMAASSFHSCTYWHNVPIPHIYNTSLPITVSIPYNPVQVAWCKNLRYVPDSHIMHKMSESLNHVVVSPLSAIHIWDVQIDTLVHWDRIPLNNYHKSLSERVYQDIWVPLCKILVRTTDTLLLVLQSVNEGIDIPDYCISRMY